MNGDEAIAVDATDSAADTAADTAARAARAAQSQRLELVGRLAGGVAHDFNNLLAGILSYVDLVSSSLAQELTSRGLLGDAAFVSIAADIDEIGAVANRAAALTRQLLIFSRREVVQPKVLAVGTVVRELEGLLRRAVGEGIDVRLDVTAEVPRVKADRGQLEQICMNLVVNARDAMPFGGTVLVGVDDVVLGSADAARRDLPAGRYVRLVVEDTGEGMSAETADRAFEPYYTTKPSGRGSGLGLATVYGIATNAGGDVRIDSTPGVGTTVTVLVPVTDELPPPEDDAWTLRPPRGQGEIVLLAEDEATVRESVRRLLTRNGYVVLAANGADDALALLHLHGEPPALLLTDVVMPGRSGRELAAQVTALVPGLPVVFMSGYTEDAIAHEGVVDAGVTLMRKPFPAGELLRTVRAVIDGVRA